MWESACRVWELKGEVWDLSSHQLPLNLTLGDNRIYLFNPCIDSIQTKPWGVPVSDSFELEAERGIPQGKHAVRSRFLCAFVETQIYLKKNFFPNCSTEFIIFRTVSSGRKPVSVVSLHLHLAFTLLPSLRK